MFVNLTPHAVNLQFPNGDTVPLLSAGEARVTTFSTPHPLPDAGGFPVETLSFGPITGLPDPQEGIIYIVSMMTAQAAAATGRFADIVSPGKLLRYPKDHPQSGQPYACTSLTAQAPQ